MKETDKSGPGMVQFGSVQCVIGYPFRVPNRPRKMLVETLFIHTVIHYKALVLRCSANRSTDRCAVVEPATTAAF